MKFNFKPTYKNVFKYLYILLIFTNIIAILAVIKFTDKYVLGAISIDRSTLVSEENVLTGDVDMEKFDKAYQKLINKKTKNDIYSLKNMFK